MEETSLPQSTSSIPSFWDRLGLVKAAFTAVQQLSTGFIVLAAGISRFSTWGSLFPQIRLNPFRPVSKLAANPCSHAERSLELDPCP